MKIGASFYTFDEKVSYKEAILESKKAGYDGVEFVLSATGELNMSSTEKDIAALADIVKGEGMEVCSVGSWNIWQNNLVSDDSAEAARAKDILKKQIDIAQITGADTVLTIPGWVGTDFAPGIVSYDKAYDRAIAAISELSSYAKAAKVYMGVENVWNRFLLSPLEMRNFIDTINSEYVGAYFDVGNIIYIGYPEQWISILNKRIKKLHFCDCRGNQCGLGMFVDLFEGDVNFPAVMNAIKEIGYDDWLTVEFLPNYKIFPYQSIINARHSMRTLLEQS